jgi:hypothetical protein
MKTPMKFAIVAALVVTVVAAVTLRACLKKKNAQIT